MKIIEHQPNRNTGELIESTHSRNDNPVYHIDETFQTYLNVVRRDAAREFDLSRMFPGLRTRPLSPGAMVTLVADTGTSKTMLLQMICLAYPQLKIMCFEFEWDRNSMAERWLAMINQVHPEDIHRLALETDANAVEPPYRDYSGTKTWIVDCSNMSVAQMQSTIERHYEKIDLVIVDYIGLVSAPGSRYERASNVAEGLKILARETRTVLIACSQMPRKERGHDGKVGLHDAKGSGSIEASSQLVLGMWVAKDDPVHVRHIRVLKSNHRGAGAEIRIRFDWHTTSCTEETFSQPEHDGYGYPV